MDAKNDMVNRPRSYLWMALDTLLAALIVGVVIFNPPGWGVQIKGSIIGGGVITIIGIFFIISYIFEEKSRIFRFFIWVCVTVSWPSRREMALFYGVLFGGGGILIILKDVGFIS